MIDYVKKLKDDLLEQFKGRPNVEALVEVIGKQFNDVYSFYEQIRNETDIYTAVGKQLDGIGDIVVLSRSETGKMITGNTPTNILDDETYRQYLIYKVLKNTCNCTYYDIMKAINMFWSGPPLKYSENSDYPATVIFDFDASKENAVQAMGIPFVKAGGIGLYMRMHKNDELGIYVGFVLRRTATSHIECDEATIESHAFLTDEYDEILTDENNDCLICDGDTIELYTYLTDEDNSILKDENNAWLIE